MTQVRPLVDVGHTTAGTRAVLVPVGDGLRGVLLIWTQPGFLGSMFPMSGFSQDLFSVVRRFPHWSAFFSH